jgi:hypothetical protein
MSNAELRNFVLAAASNTRRTSGEGSSSCGFIVIAAKEQLI